MRRALGLAIVLLGCGSRTHMEVGALDAGVAPDAGARDAAPVPPFDAGSRVCARTLEITFEPVARAQIGMWIEAEERFATIALTEATSYRGIGNRPGALQMNSGYRWPVGRRENVLPAWAAARLAAGGPPFRRVIYRGRPEGSLGSTGVLPDAYHDTRDNYFCMSFDPTVMSREGLDAVTCASHWSGDKGRYLTDADVAAGYAEPGESAPGVGGFRVLTLESAYPPRRDVLDTADDHPDVARYAADALELMPELDAVTMATPRADGPFTRVFRVPDAWPAGPARVSIEVSTEGDYAPVYGPLSYPTPTMPADAWDPWAQSYGYPYLGQPSVIFDVAIELPPREGAATLRTHIADRPARRGTLDASLGVLPIDDTIVDDPLAHPGSGAERLRSNPAGHRVTVLVRCEP